MLSNESRKIKIIDNVKFADSFWRRFKGLMFERKENFNYALIFELGNKTRIEGSIHMLFVFFPIDVVYLDEEKGVIEIAKNIKPWTLNYTPKKPAKFFIELPAGKAERISLEDRLEWQIKR